MQITKLLARIGLAAFALATLGLQLSSARAQGTAFTYQGVLSQSGAAVNGSNDLTFTLYDAASGGNTAGTSNVVNDLLMTNGLFTVALDFGASAFIGSARWLQTAVRPGASTGAYTNFAPRQPITATPYALFAAGANASTLIGAIPSTSLSGTYNVAVTLNNAGNVFAGNGSNLTALNASQLTGGTVPSAALSNAWKITGNAGTAPGTHFLGTTDNQPLELRVNGQRALRLEYAVDAGTPGVNVIGGYSGNAVSSGVIAATIGGGGTPGATNHVTGSYGTVAGGDNNTAGFVATVAGGQNNTASGFLSAVPGGLGNVAAGVTSFAAGNAAKANHTGAFVWCDRSDPFTDFASTADNQFNVRAAGGARFVTSGAGLSVDGPVAVTALTSSGNVGIGTASPAAPLDVLGLMQVRSNGAIRSIPITFGGSFNGMIESYYADNDRYGLAQLPNGITALYAASAFAPSSIQFGQMTSSSNFSPQMIINHAGDVAITGAVTAAAFSGPINEPPITVVPVLGMIWLKPGAFLMGSRIGEPGRNSDEGPQTWVTLTKGFWMGAHEVTQGEYLKGVGSNPSSFTGDTNRPVETVTWNNATNYCGLLTTSERAAGRIPNGWGYRLPTEAEWEYACRAGARTTRFGYGDDIAGTALGNYAWISANSAGTTHPVEQKLANPWGLMDMHGNVVEWCQDIYGPYPGGSVTDPQGAGSGSSRVMRGGAYLGPTSTCRSATRDKLPTGNFDNYIGFRVVLSSGQP